MKHDYVETDAGAPCAAAGVEAPFVVQKNKIPARTDSTYAPQSGGVRRAEESAWGAGWITDFKAESVGVGHCSEGLNDCVSLQID